MLVDHMYIMIFIAQSITQQKKKEVTVKKLSLQLFYDQLGHVYTLLTLLLVYIYSKH